MCVWHRIGVHGMSEPQGKNCCRPSALCLGQSGKCTINVKDTGPDFDPTTALCWGHSTTCSEVTLDLHPQVRAESGPFDSVQSSLDLESGWEAILNSSAVSLSLHVQRSLFYSGFSFPVSGLFNYKFLLIFSTLLNYCYVFPISVPS